MQGLIILSFAALALAAPQGYTSYYSQLSHQQHMALADHVSHNQQGFQLHQQQPLITKHFFLHAAPEEDEEGEVQHKDIVVGQPRKNFNVVFIKSPSGAGQKTKLRIIPAVNEERTAIYVLAKKASEHEVVAHVEEPYTTTARPEVFFIKYRTNEEAEHAQQTIQAEYDRLGGPSFISNEGIAPTSSVIGSLERPDGGADEGDTIGTGYDTVNNAYLPTAHK